MSVDCFVPRNDEIAHIVEYQDIKNAFFRQKSPLAGADLQSVPHDTGKAPCRRGFAIRASR